MLCMIIGAIGMFIGKAINSQIIVSFSLLIFLIWVIAVVIEILKTGEVI